MNRRVIAAVLECLVTAGRDSAVSAPAAGARGDRTGPARANSAGVAPQQGTPTGRRKRLIRGIAPSFGCHTGWMTRHDPMRFMENIFGIFGHPSASPPPSSTGERLR